MIQAPFPWFGGKSRVADLVWQRFGDVHSYVEPFAGSLAVLLGRPDPTEDRQRIETTNDLDGFIANFWRSLQADPEAVAHYADWPVSEVDLHARHLWLLARREELTSRMMADPDHYDAKIAGFWVWGICSWIGSGWCSGEGPWQSVDGLFVKGNAGQGVTRQLPHLGSSGQGVHRKLPHLGDAGKGVHRQVGILPWMLALADRLRRVRVTCGDWSRVTGPSVLFPIGQLAGVFLDPPYADTAERCADLYAQDSLAVAYDVREWAIKHGSDSRLRIALCGYEGEHEMPKHWECVAWKAKGGYENQGANSGVNSRRERIWFSPACLRSNQGVLL